MAITIKVVILVKGWLKMELSGSITFVLIIPVLNHFTKILTSQSHVFVEVQLSAKCKQHDWGWNKKTCLIMLWLKMANFLEEPSDGI